jgi:hypothetical protein
MDLSGRPPEPDAGHNGCMDLERASQDLYGLAPNQFVAARDAKSSEARQAGRPDLASALKKLRKPSVGAWLANLLALEEPTDVERLIDLGVKLRAPNHKVDGEEIRRVSKEKGDAVSKLVRDARSMATRIGQPVSAAALQELEATLEAGFADAQAAERLREGRLSGGLHYSGLGFPAQIETGSPSRTKGAASTQGSRSEGAQIAARRNLEKANREVEQADAEVKKARKAVAETADQLTRLKSAEALAVRRSKDAHVRAVAAKKKLRGGR